MATIRKRGKKWFAQIRRKGFPSTSRSFASQAAAKAWATDEEARIDRGETKPDHALSRQVTLAEIITLYLERVTPSKQSAVTERQRLTKLRDDPVCELSLGELATSHIADYRDRRLKTVGPGTIRRELSLLRHALYVAHTEWGFHISRNPVASVRRPKPPQMRDRRLRPGEYDRLMQAISTARNPLLSPFVRWAIETGMRRGEILDLRWENIDLVGRMARIPHTKTGHPRTIPLTDSAIVILMDLKPNRAGPVFGASANALKHSWVRAVERSGLLDFHFHDLRHEAISRFFEMGLSVPEVAIISGHRDPTMLLRYTHLRPIDLAHKLAGRSWVKEKMDAEAAYKARQTSASS